MSPAIGACAPERIFAMIRVCALAGVLAAGFAFSSISPAVAQSDAMHKRHHAAKPIAALLAEGNIPQVERGAGQPFGYENSYVTNSALPSTAALSTPFMSDRFYSLPGTFELP
jgi:hypothetical protein